MPGHVADENGCFPLGQRGHRKEIAANAPSLRVLVRFAARHEYARTVEDVLARRSRWLFLDAGRAGDLAPQVGSILTQETGTDPAVDACIQLAQRYRTLPD